MREHAVDERQELLARAGAVHGAQDARVHVLQRDVEVVAYVVVRGHGIQQLVGKAFGLDVHDAEPGLRELLGQRGHERRQRRRLVEVGAPAPRVLGDEHDLAGAGSHLGGDVCAHVVEREAAIAPADVRDGAVRAEPVATVGNLHVGERRGREGGKRRTGSFDFGGSAACAQGHGGGGSPARGVDAKRVGYDSGDIVLAAAWHERTRFHKLVRKILAVAGGHAAGHDERRARRDVGHPGRIENGFDALLGGALDERAGVHHHGVRFGRVDLYQKPGLRQPHAHARRVSLVLRASQRDESDAGRNERRVR